VLHVERHRFFQVHVLARVDRVHEVLRVQMLRRGDDDGIDGLVVQQTPVIEKSGGAGHKLLRVVQALGVDVGEPSQLHIGARQSLMYQSVPRWPAPLTPSNFVGNWLLTKSEPPQMRVSPDGARLVPFTSTQVFGAIVARSPSAFATSEITGELVPGEPAASEMVNVAVATRMDEFRAALARSDDADAYPVVGAENAGGRGQRRGQTGRHRANKLAA